MQRIIAGSLRGRRLLDLPRELAEVRPTGARARGAIFDRLQHEVVNANVLDVFAGTGALGLEALSRGAAAVSFVEQSRRVHQFLERQIAALRVEPRCDVSRSDARAFLSRPAMCAYDLVFVDPPYAAPESCRDIAALLLEFRWLAPSAIVVLEHDTVKSRANVEICPAGYRVDARRRYGQTAVDFLSVDDS